jgi:hypothetical protein
VHPGNATCCPGGSAEAACVPTLTITPSSITTTGCSTHSEGVSSRFAVTTVRITTETTAKRALARVRRVTPVLPKEKPEPQLRSSDVLPWSLYCCGDPALAGTGTVTPGAFFVCRAIRARPRCAVRCVARPRAAGLAGSGAAVPGSAGRTADAAPTPPRWICSTGGAAGSPARCSCECRTEPTTMTPHISPADANPASGPTNRGTRRPGMR